MPHRNSFYSSGSISPGSRSESPLAVQTSPKLALSPSHHQPQTSPQASSPSLTHHAALRGVQSSPLGMVVPGMIPFYGIPSPAGSRSPRSPPMLSPIVATPNYNNSTNSGNTNPTGRDAPLNLTKPRGSSQDSPDQRSLHSKSPGGGGSGQRDSSPRAVHPPPAHSNHHRSLHAPLPPPPDMSTVIKRGAFNMAGQQYVSNPYAGLPHTHASLANLAVNSAVAAAAAAAAQQQQQNGNKPSSPKIDRVSIFDTFKLLAAKT